MLKSKKAAPSLKEFYDISPEISSAMAVFPGDTPFRRKVALDIGKGDNIVLSSIETTVHLGAHVDAPNHYHADGQSIETRSLDYYLGGCQVVSVNVKSGNRIFPKDLGGVVLSEKRILFKTSSFANPNQWTEDFVALSPELVEHLACQNVILVGIDTPSIDPSKDPDLKAHQAVYKHDMAVLEGIVLDEVADGVYNLVALPLKIKGADASPVRAILCKR